MEAKLIKGKNSGEYLLDMEGVGYITTYESTLPYKLSLKNCQAIELGYDLDELVDKVITTDFENELYVVKKISKIVAKEVAKAILEILSDKKFSEEDMKNTMNWIMNEYFEFHEQPTTARREHYIQSLQQTEWDVEIVEVENDEVYSVSENMKVAHNKAFDGVLFKYDADGCLILRKI